MEDRIIELETRVAHQAKLLNELDEVVQNFGWLLDAMAKRLRWVEEEQLQRRDEMEPHNTPPPHY